MADAVTTHVMYEDAVRYVAKFTNVSDGTGEADVVKVDVSALTPACAEVDIIKIWYTTDGMAVRIEFDATTDTLAWALPNAGDGFIDFSTLYGPGGLRNNSGTGKTGDVLFTTVGHTSGDTYSVILECKKRQTAEI